MVKNLRTEMNDLMFELSDKLSLKSDTTQLAMVYLDRLINKFDMSKVNQQAPLWAISLLLIASKFNEKDKDIPYIDDFRSDSAQK